jgi:hypothetical protein
MFYLYDRHLASVLVIIIRIESRQNQIKQVGLPQLIQN